VPALDEGRARDDAGWPAAILLRQVRLSLLVGLPLLTAGAWALTLYQSLVMADMAVMDGMSAARWSFGSAAVFVALWTVMMAAMMLPAAAPMILVFGAAQARRGRDAAVPTWIFAAGYLLVWLAAGLPVYAVTRLADAFLSAAADPAGWTPLALGATLLAAGVYQLTPLKRVCLDHCRSPLGFVARHWRDGRLGALRMGLLHGAYCLGCCWALFAVLVAAGMMSLPWMLLLALVVFAEKVLPHGRRTAAAVGVALIALGLLVADGALPAG
jgi:predicted metal-binding membrane protein